MAASERDLPMLAARRVGKTFRVPEQQVHTLKERALHPLRRIGKREYRALNDVSFAVGSGEFFGIVGRNGSGKSTLLKCMAGIYSFEGDIWRRGRVSTFIELGVGFNPDLAARDNVITNGIMMGLTPREARMRYDAVIDFAELREFQDLKLKNYSSGMHVRLAFSVAIQVDADILLVDEILAVGDAAFQQKCFDVFNQMRRQGKTLVLVTHSMEEMNRFCDRALLLERGAMVALGDPRQVAERYLELNFGRGIPSEHAADARDGDGAARVQRVWLEDQDGNPQSAIPQGQRATLRVQVRFAVDVDDPQVTVTVLAEDRRPVIVASTMAQNDRTGEFRAGEEAGFSFAFDNVLAPGRYDPVVTVSHRGSGVNVIDRLEGVATFVVTAVRPLGGAIDLPVEVTIERQEADSRLPA